MHTHTTPSPHSLVFPVTGRHSLRSERSTLSSRECGSGGLLEKEKKKSERDEMISFRGSVRLSLSSS